MKANSSQKKDKIKIIDILNKIEKGIKGSNNIIKLKIKYNYDDDSDIFLVLENSLKLYRDERTYGDSEMVMLDAFIKNNVFDMKTCKDPLIPWNFKRENISEQGGIKLEDYCFVRRVLKKDKLVVVLSGELTKEENELQYTYKNKFLKIGNDEFIEFGDDLMVPSPLYFNKQLPINSDVKTNLTKQLNKLGEERKDWHEENPVLDIIDPDLNPNYLSPTDMQKILDEFKKQKKKHYYLCDEDFLNNFPESLSLRSQYKWIPTEFLISKDLKVSLLGPIHNLPKKGNSELYANIVKVFEAILPGFQKLNLLKENEDTILQVVVKAQKYEIKPGTKFSEKWQIEDKTENIVATGVYYCNVDKGFEEDKLLYRNYIFPDPLYSYDYLRTLNYELDVFDGSAVVFSNILPYKFNLVNSTQSTLARTFLKFFIVDPSKPIQCDGGKQEYWRLLKLMKMKNIIIGHVLKFLSPLKYDPLEVAKEKRKLVRECMKTENSGWGVVHRGEDYHIEFFDAFHEFYNPERFDEIEGVKAYIK